MYKVSKDLRHIDAACRYLLLVAELEHLEFLEFELVDRVVPLVGNWRYCKRELQRLPEKVRKTDFSLFFSSFLLMKPQAL